MVSRKNILVVDAADASASVTSDPIDVRDLVIGSIQVVFTGSTAGTVKLQASNDVYQFLKQPSPQPAPTNWTDVDNSSQSVSGAGTVMYNLTSMGYDILRIVYTRASGTGTMSARMVGKG